jgi:hypothetical protein
MQKGARKGSREKLVVYNGSWCLRHTAGDRIEKGNAPPFVIHAASWLYLLPVYGGHVMVSSMSLEAMWKVETR